MFNMRIQSLLIGMAAVIVAIFGAATAFQQYEGAQTAINSPQYDQIIRTKDLLADVLPPPAYLVESYLEATLALNEPEAVEAHAARLEKLKRDYFERHGFWSDRSLWAVDDNFNEDLFNLITEGSHAEALKFWAAVENDLIPAIRSGDQVGIDAAHDAVDHAYAAHRAQVDEIVRLAIADQAALERRAAEEITQVMLVDFAVVMLALAMVVGAFYMLHSRVIRPVASVTGVMKKMAEGDLKSSVAGAERKDEIGEMVRALEVFRKNLLDMESMRAEQAESAKKMEIAKRESLREMAATVEAEASTAVNHVSEQASAMTRLAQSMAGSVANVTDQCQGVAAAAEQAMMSATSVTAATQQFSASIQEVSQQLGRARTATAETVETSERTRAAVGNLADAVSKIGDVANIISEIADQTNLLALNATIEAARAGEAGRGFAVVASEVKSLSSQTARSTEEIRRHVVGIQDVMRETIDIVAAIAKQINSVDDGSAAIAAAMEEQTATIHEIARHVEETAKAASYVSDTVGIVLKEAAKTGEGARSLTESVGDVDTSISRLREAIVRVVRTSTPDVERRADPRYDVNVSGTLVEKQATVKVKDMSRGGALIDPEADLRGGETGKLKVADAQIQYKVLGRDKAGAHLQFETNGSPDFEKTLKQLTRGAPSQKAG